MYDNGWRDLERHDGMFGVNIQLLKQQTFLREFHKVMNACVQVLSDALFNGSRLWQFLKHLAKRCYEPLWTLVEYSHIFLL